MYYFIVFFSWFDYNWAMSIPGCVILLTHDDNNNNNNLFSVQCNTSFLLMKDCKGIIQTQWCDNHGLYGIWSFTFHLDASLFISTSTATPSPSLPTSSSSSDSFCSNLDNQNSSLCQVVGPSLVTIIEGESSIFSLELQCPILSSCQVRTHWTTTFG